MKLNAVVVCGPGRVRKQNQDNFYLNGSYRGQVDCACSLIGMVSCDESGVFAVADGMGGEKHGELASLETVRCLRQAHRNGRPDLASVINTSNERVCDLINAYGGDRIGTTFVGCVFTEHSARITNIGDSRAYLFSRGRLEKVSRDHTVIQQLLDFGIIDEEKAKTHPSRHKITQHIGLFPDELIIEPYSRDIDLVPGDLILLCSDGLTDMVDDTAIAGILGATGSFDKKAEALFKNALFNGGKDNTTVIVIEVVQ